MQIYLISSIHNNSNIHGEANEHQRIISLNKASSVLENVEVG